MVSNLTSEGIRLASFVADCCTTRRGDNVRFPLTHDWCSEPRQGQGTLHSHPFSTPLKMADDPTSLGCSVPFLVNKYCILAKTPQKNQGSILYIQSSGSFARFVPLLYLVTKLKFSGMPVTTTLRMAVKTLYGSSISCWQESQPLVQSSSDEARRMSVEIRSTAAIVLTGR
jgi:hypothetical protein